MLLKGLINAAEHGRKGNAGILPGFNQGPIERREQQACPAPPLKVLLNFGEVVEIIFHDIQRRGLLPGQGLAGILSADLGAACALAVSRGFAFRSQIMRRPLRVRKSSTALMYFDPSPNKLARPPVATTLQSCPISASSNSKTPSTSPR